MLILFVFIYENFLEVYRRSFSCFFYFRLVCSSRFKRMIGVLNIGMLKNILFLVLTIVNVIFLFLNLWFF